MEWKINREPIYLARISIKSSNFYLSAAWSGKSAALLKISFQHIFSNFKIISLLHISRKCVYVCMYVCVYV